MTLIIKDITRLRFNEGMTSRRNGE